jgi:type IV pilus assembly protein PilB
MASVSNNEKIVEFLISEGIISREQAENIISESKEAGKDIFNVILDKKLAGEEKLAKAKADFLGVPYINLEEETISGEALDEIPEESAAYYGFIPFEKKGKSVKVAMANPGDIEAQEALKFISEKHNLKTEVYLVSQSVFNFLIKQYRTVGSELETALEGVDEGIKLKEAGRAGAEKEDGAEKFFKEAPISKIVDIILKHAIEGRASDIHIEPLEKESRVRYRLDGVLHTSLVLPLKVHPAVVSRIKILANLKIDENRKPQDGRFHFLSPEKRGKGKGVDLRISTFPVSNGEKVVMRILDTSSGVKTLEELGVLGRNLEVLEENIKKAFGMILVTGPTGSGKSTTLYAILNIINQEGVNIITLEDPIEYRLGGVNQSQVNAEIGFTFASGLRSILRQDPDVIMVGEIRDHETAELATHAALTGHLVLSTLHTNDAIGVVPRLIDMGIEPFLISSSLNIIIAQRLVRRICEDCKEEFKAAPGMEKMILEELEDIPAGQKEKLNLNPPLRLFRGKGCKRCGQKGLSGRISICEALAVSSELEKIISEKPSEDLIKKEAKRQGMITMRQDGIIKALNGLTTMEEVLKASEE